MEDTPKNRRIFLVGMAALSAKIMVCGCGEKKPLTESKTIYEYWWWDAKIIFKDAKSNVKTLIQAIEKDDLDKITSLVKGGADVNARGKMDITPLVWALLADDETFRKLLELGADPNIPVDLTKYKEDAKSDFICCNIGPGGTVINILCNGIDSEVNSFKNTAGINDDRPKLRAALEYGGNPNALVSEYGYSPLMQVGDWLCGMKWGTRLLLDAGADPNYAAPGGETVLQRFLATSVADDHQIELIEMLLDAGADICAGESGNDIVMSLVWWQSFENQRPLSDAFHRLRDRVIALGVNYELAKEMIEAAENHQSEMDINALRRLPFNKRPWLPCYEPDEEEPQEQEDE